MKAVKIWQDAIGKYCLQAAKGFEEIGKIYFEISKYKEAF